jgi:hypothetical protein
MEHKLHNPKRIALFAGLSFSFLHLTWAILVLTKVAKPLMDWILSLHFLTIDYTVSDFNFLTAAKLIAFTFILGYATGFLFTTVWNMIDKSKKTAK